MGGKDSETEDSGSDFEDAAGGTTDDARSSVAPDPDSDPDPDPDSDTESHSEVESQSDKLEEALKPAPEQAPSPVAVAEDDHATIAANGNATEDQERHEEEEHEPAPLTTPETPSFPSAPPIPAPLKSVTAHYNAGSNPALSQSGGGGGPACDASPSIAGAVWRSSGGLAMAGLEEVDLGKGNPVVGSSPTKRGSNGLPKGKGKEVVVAATAPSESSSSTSGEGHSASSSPSIPISSVSTSVRDSFIRLRDEDRENGSPTVDWEFWGKVMADYEGVAASQPKELSAAIQRGIPSALRGMTWQLMAASKDPNLEASYKALLKQQSPHEKSIGRDLNRTFPKHEFFQEGGAGQDSLFNIVKAYSLFDDEVGYTQGLQFIVGPLLLNMPEEESFCVLVRLMQSYDLRSHYTPNMPGLQLRLFQFDRLLEELLPKVFMHLLRQGVKSSMYGSQWFLTLYGYRFPLELVSVVFDLVFAEGVEAVFRFAISILQRNEEKILSLEFEHLIEFLKNGLFDAYAPDPKDQEGLYKVDEFVREAIEVNISPSMLDHFLEEWTSLVSAQTAHTAELDTLRRANAQLSAQLRRLETSLAQINLEHCELVKQVVTSRLEREELEDELVKYKTAFADLSHRQESEGARSPNTPRHSFTNAMPAFTTPSFKSIF